MTGYEVLMPISILGTFSFGVYVFTKTLTDYFLRRKMVEKGYVTEESKHLLAKEQEVNKYNSLKWGIITLFAGIGLVVIEFLPRRDESVLPFGIFAISVSIGFLIYFFISKTLSDKE